MLDNQEVVNFLNDKLNHIVDGQSYFFNIFSEVGKSKDDGKIDGILRVVQNEPLPVPNVTNVSYKAEIDLIAPAGISNKAVIKIEKILGAFVKAYNGKEQQFSEGKGLLTFSLAKTGDFKTEYSYGNILPLSFTININYAEGVYTPGARKWLLNGVEIPYVSESVIVEKNGKTSPINTRKYQQTFMTTQMKWYHFRFPFVDNDLCNGLYKDLLDGDMNKKYNLTYYDGVNYPENNPYTAKVVIFRNGDIDSQIPNTPMFDITFADADDGNNNIRYEIGLLDNPFDGASENTRWFDNQTEQRIWFDEKIASTQYCDLEAVNLNSLVLTSQIYKNIKFTVTSKPTYENAMAGDYYYLVIDDFGYNYKSVKDLNETEYASVSYVYTKSNNDVFDMVNKNYAVIRVTRNQFSVIPKPSYADTSTINVYYLSNGEYKLVTAEMGSATYNALPLVYTNQLYYFYRVASADIGADNQVIYSLGLDSVQTWMFQLKYDNQTQTFVPSLEIDDSFINKAHLDRWIYSYEEITPLPTLAQAQIYGYYYKSNNEYKLITENMTPGGYASITHVYEKIATFNGKADSKLFEREDIKDIAKRLVNRKKIYLRSAQNSDIVEWINEHVICWVYVIVKPNDDHIIKVQGNDGYGMVSTYASFHISTVDYGYYVFCYPLYKTIHNIVLTSKLNISDIGTDMIIDTAGFKHYVEKNYMSSIASIKLSVKPPIDLDQNTYSYFKSDSNLSSADLYLIGSWNDGSDKYKIELKLQGNGNYHSTTEEGLAFGNTSGLTGLFNIKRDASYPILFETNMSLPQISFRKSEIVGSLKDKKFNPKLNSQDYKTLNLTFAGSSQEYDIQKLNKSKARLKYNELITADTSKIMLRLDIPNDTQAQQSIFNYSYGESFNGFIATNDLSLPIVTTNFDTYIANNKNAYLSFQAQQNYNVQQVELENKYARTNMGLNFVSGITSSFTGSENPTGAMGGFVGSLLGVVKSQNQQYQNEERVRLQNSYQKTQFNLSIDNMKNAPGTLVNANGSALFTGVVDEFGIYAELYEGLDTELESANDIMFRDGFNYNRFEGNGENIRDYCHTRKYFNYIQAVLGNLHGISISDTMRADLKDRFSKGIRFWHQDNIDYSLENYELELEK